MSAGAAWRELRWYLTKRYIAGFGRISGGGGKLHKYLRRQGRRYAKRGSKMQGEDLSQAGVDIDERPEIVELKEKIW